MKKRLFITTALMTAVLGCSLATGTYAWYEVGAGEHGTVSKSQQITTKTENLSDFVITDTWAFGLQGSTSTTATPVSALALTGNDGLAYVVNNAGILVTAASESKYYEVTVTLSAKAQDLIDHQNETYKIEVVGTNRARVAPKNGKWYTAAECTEEFTISKPVQTGDTMVEFKKYSFYVSMTGNASDVTPEVDQQVQAETTASLTGTVTFNLTYVTPVKG